MKNIKQFLLTMLVALVSCVSAYAYDFRVDGIYYNKFSDGQSVEVTYKEYKNYTYSSPYSGAVTIPSTVTYSGKTYSVTSIGYAAFYGCTGLKSVEIPASVTMIGNSAFYGCTGLTSFSGKFASEDNRCLIVDGVLNSFAPAEITEYTIPNSVTSIGISAFRGCTGLTSVEIPNSVTTIGDNAFQYCSNLTSFSGKFASEDNRCLIVDGVLNSFAPAEITEYTIPNSVTSIGISAFRGCTGLTSVEIPNSVTTIGSFAFYDCSSLASVEIGNSVTTIGDNAFKGCTSLTLVEIPNSVTEIEYAAFAGCSSLTAVEIPNSVTEIGSSAFYDCSNLTSVVIGNSVTTIYPWAFSNCSSLTSVNLNATNCTSMGSYESPVFYGCSNLKTVTIGNGVQEIPNFAFYKCSSLKSVTIGTGVLTVGTDAFKNCTSLYKLVLLPNTVPTGLAAALPSVPAEGRRTYVANNNYSGYVYGTIRRYDYLSSWFEVDGIRYVPVSPSERTCAAIDCNYASTPKNIVIGESVIYRGVPMKVAEINPFLLVENDSINTIEVAANSDISTYFAKGCTNIQNIKLNNSGTIGASAFSGCSGLKTARLSEKITDIGKSAFYNCSNLESINIPASITTIEESTFSGCNKLANIDLPAALTTIKSYAFKNSGLTSIVIPAATTSIGDDTFNGCTKLTMFKATDGEKTLTLGYNYSNKGLFYDCPLKEVKIGRNLSYNTSSSYGYSPFYRNANLEKVTLTDIPTEVFTNEFYGCTALKEVNIGDGVTKIGNYAFSGCSVLESFSFGASVQSIGDEAFSDCTAMTSLYAEPTTPPTCGTQALDDINKWDCTLYVPEAAKANYMAANQWKDFFFMEGYDFSDAITSIPETATTPVAYTLGGYRVTKPGKGLYIINGKKTIVR